MTWVELVKQYFPNADDDKADFILWEFTAFPISMSEATIRGQLKKLKKHRAQNRLGGPQE